MKIGTNKFISLTYDLNVEEDGKLELMERATAETPLEFIFGTGTMLEAFEANLDGKVEGDEFNFVLQPGDAYGEYIQEHLVDLPKDLFEQGGQFNADVIAPGNTVPMMDASGNRLNGLVVEVKDNEVVMDFNHPLAGRVLNFSGKVLGVREATAEELTALFAPQGGGCGSGCSCSSGGCGSSDDEDQGGCGCGSGGCGC